jgi:zinc protease
LEAVDFVLGFFRKSERIAVAYSTGSFYKARKEHGVFGVYALTKSESTLSVISLIRNIVRDIQEKSPCGEDLKMAKNAILNNFIFSFTSAEQIAFQQLLLKFNDLPDGFLISYRDRIDKVKANEIMEAAKLHLSPKRAVVLIIGNETTYRDISSMFQNVKRIERNDR